MCRAMCRAQNGVRYWGGWAWLDDPTADVLAGACSGWTGHEAPVARRGPGVCRCHAWFGPSVSAAAQAATMVKLLVAKLLCMVGVFFFMLLGALLPVKIIEMDFEKAQRSRKVLSLCNTFGGGVFLATCFNALLPTVREKVRPHCAPYGQGL